MDEKLREILKLANELRWQLGAIEEERDRLLARRCGNCGETAFSAGYVGIIEENRKLREAVEKVVHAYAPNDPPMLQERTYDWMIVVLRDALKQNDAQAEKRPAMHVPLHVCPKMSGTAWDIIQSGKPCPYCGATEVSDINSATLSEEKK